MAEMLPEGLEEQVESTIIDPIARLRESFPSLPQLKSEQPQLDRGGDTREPWRGLSHLLLASGDQFLL